MAIPPEQRQAIVQTLCQLLREAEDPRIRAKAATSLGKLGIESAIPDLCQAATGDRDLQVRLNAIDALVFIAKPDLAMSDTPKNQPSFNINQVGNINTGDVSIARDQVGIQHNSTTNPQLESALQELKSTLAELEQQHPNVTTESEAIEVIDGELTNPFPSPTSGKLALLRQQLLNPERHFQATKATLSEVVKHFLEESLWAKAFVTYLETLSSDPGQGA